MCSEETLREEGWMILPKPGFMNCEGKKMGRDKVYIRHSDMNLIGRAYIDNTKLVGNAYIRKLDFLCQEHNHKVKPPRIIESSDEVNSISVSKVEVVRNPHEFANIVRGKITINDDVHKYFAINIEDIHPVRQIQESNLDMLSKVVDNLKTSKPKRRKKQADIITIAESSNGRTADFESANLGSIPSSASKV